MRTKLKIKRMQKGIKSYQASEQLNMSRAYYSYIENGRKNPSLETWMQIQELYHIPNEEMWEIIIENKEIQE